MKRRSRISVHRSQQSGRLSQHNRQSCSWRVLPTRKALWQHKSKQSCGRHHVIQRTHMGPHRKTVLVVSRDPQLADIRTHVLEQAGYLVLTASSLTDFTDICKKQKVNLIMIGYSLPPAEKRRVWVEARKHCSVPILELYDGGKAELMEESQTYLHRSNSPEDFLEAAKSILNRRRK